MNFLPQALAAGAVSAYFDNFSILNMAVTTGVSFLAPGPIASILKYDMTDFKIYLAAYAGCAAATQYLMSGNAQAAAFSAAAVAATNYFTGQTEGSKTASDSDWKKANEVYEKYNKKKNNDKEKKKKKNNDKVPTEKKKKKIENWMSDKAKQAIQTNIADKFRIGFH